MYILHENETGSCSHPVCSMNCSKKLIQRCTTLPQL